VQTLQPLSNSFIALHSEATAYMLKQGMCVQSSVHDQQTMHTTACMQGTAVAIAQPYVPVVPAGWQLHSSMGLPDANGVWRDAVILLSKVHP
jgi:hypothetical protein